MGSDPGNLKPAGNPEKRLVTGFVEEVGADAVLVLWTWSSNNQTKSRATHWGNHFAVKGLLEWAYERTFEAEERDEDYEDDDEEEEE
tara:strand:+ start:25394 stop:25654 length:261 start_codon:yes stop_codon:yes gene_type:complete